MPSFLSLPLSSYSVEYVEDSAAIFPLNTSGFSITDDDNRFLITALLTVQSADLPSEVEDHLLATATSEFGVEGSGSSQLRVTAIGARQYFTLQEDFVTFLKTVSFDSNDQAPYVTRNITIVVQEFPEETSPPSLPAVVPVTIAPVNDRPVILSIQRSEAVLSDYVPESRNGGFSPSFLLMEGDVQDPDQVSPIAPDSIGLAVTASTSTGVGEWMYWHNDSWAALPPTSECSPWLVPPEARIRFSPSPNPSKSDGRASLLYRAWDGTAVAACVGGNRQFSAQSALSVENATFTYDVVYLNRAPSTILNQYSLPSIAEDTPTASNAGTLVSEITASVGSDPDDLYLGLAVVGANTSNGQWEYWVGGNWVPFPDQLTWESALLLTNEALVRFNPNEHYFGPSSFQALAWDMSETTPNTSSSDPFTGAFSSTSFSVSISVRFVNDPPLVRLANSELGYVEAGPAVQLFSNLTISDVDGGELAWASVLLECPLCGGGEASDGYPASGVSLTPNTSDMILTRRAPPNFLATLVHSDPTTLEVRVQAAAAGDNSIEAFVRYLETLYFISADSEPSGAPRVVSLVVNDGTDDSNTAQLTIRVELINDERPVLILPYPSVTWVEDSGPLSLFSSPVQILDSDDNALFLLEEATLELQGHDPVLENLSLSLNCSSLGLSCGYSSGVLSVAGSESVATYEQVLSGVLYVNTNPEPESSPREVYVSVSDGRFYSERLRLVVEVELVNDQLPELVLASPVVSFQESNPTSSPVRVAANASLSDSDSGIFPVHSATLTLLDPQNQDMEGLQLGAPPPGIELTLPGHYAHTLTISSAGGVSLTALQDALQMVEYFNTAAQPLGAGRTIEIVVYDNLTQSGVGGSVPVQVGVVFQLVNDLPEVRLNQDIVEYSEGQEPREVGVALNGEILDVDDGEISGLLVQLTVNGTTDTSQEMLRVSLEGLDQVITPLSSSGPLLINLTGTAPVDNYTTVLQSLTYEHFETFGAPDSGVRTITVTPLSLGGLPGVSDAVIIAFSSVNNAPAVDLNGLGLPGLDSSVLFQEESPEPVSLVAVDFVLEDVDNESLAYMNIILSPVLDEGSEVIEVNASISPSIDVAHTSSFIELSGEAAVADYRSVLATLTYQNSADEPNTTVSRVISVEASDGLISGFARSEVTVIPRNDPPTLILQDSLVRFVEGEAPVQIAPSAQVFDPDSLIEEYRVQPVAEFPGDVITGPGLSLVPGMGGVYMATLGPTSPSDVPQLLAQLMFSNTLPEPPAGDRVLCLSVRDEAAAPSPESCVTVQFQPVNDNVPQFQQPSYQAEVRENRPNIFVVQVIATDGDSDNSNVTLTYSITAGDDCSPDSSGDGGSGSGLLSEEVGPCRFEIDPSTGQITTTSQPPDREAEDSYTLTVTVSDGLHSSSAEVVVSIADENDVAPVFDPELYEVTIPLGAPVGYELAQLNVVDPDLDDAFSIIQISMNPNSGMNAFILDPDIPGRVLLNRLEEQLDPTVPQYTLTFEAVDSFFHFSPTTATLVVNVILNQEAPLFQMPGYTASVAESAGDGEFVLLVSASDSDAGSHGEFIFSIAEIVPFAVNAQTGVITVSDSSAIDFEMTQEYVFTVVATDNGRPQMSSSADITVGVVNINDNAPVFERMRYEVLVCESSPVGHTALQTGARDEDGDALSYSLLEMGGCTGCVAVNSSTGALTIVRELDFEEQQSFSFSIMASDGTHPADAAVIVHVLNDNEEPPMFRFESLGLEIPEIQLPGTPLPFPPFLIPLADDSDNCNVDQCEGSEVISNETCSSGSGLQYSILSGNEQGLFEINPSTGLISLIQNLDFDVQAHRQFNLSVAVWDGQQQDTAMLLITVTDSDDNQPVFQNSSYSIILPEDTPVGTVVLPVVATDLDPTDVLMYSLAGENAGHFSIGSSSGLVEVAQPLDYESVAEYSLIVAVTDRPSSTNDSAVLAELTITITDVNDVVPQFTQEVFNFTILENTPPPAPLGVVQAVDEDPDEGSGLRYSIVSVEPDYPGAFVIDEVEGQLICNVTLDRERQSAYSLTVLVVDGGIPPLSSSAVVHVEVLDVNDHHPVFEGGDEPLSVSVSESTAVQIIILTLSASDQDTGGNARLTFTIASGNSRSDFALDAQTGELSVAQPLDYEMTTQYSLVVQVSDAGSQPLSSTRIIVINIEDANDNPPEFLQPSYSAVVVEGAPFGASVLQVQATDRDTGANAAIRYNIAVAVPSNPFSIDPETGLITVASSQLLDRETTPQFLLTVAVYNPNDLDDPGSTVSVTVTLEDVDDNAPQFTMDVFTVSIPEDFTPVLESDPSDVISPDTMFSASGSGVVLRQLITVMANDRDDPSTPNGQFSFSIIGEEQNQFFINPQTGEVYVTSTLDREQQDFYQIMVQVADLGTPPLSSVGAVNVTVTDVNDNAPVFGQESYTADVAENQPANFEVFSVSAEDFDLGVNAELQFSIVGGSIPFQIDPQSGAVRTTRPLDRETQASWSFQVQVTDSGTSQLSSLAGVTVEVLDENDNAPSISPAQVGMALQENVPAGTVVQSFLISDQDSGVNAEYTVSLSSHTELFSVSSSGVLAVAGPIDYEMMQEIDLVVVVRNTAPPHSEVTAVVAITVENENDNPPVVHFTSSSVEYYEGFQQLELSLGITIVDNDGRNVTNLLDGIVEFVNPDPAEPSFSFSPTTEGLYVPYHCPLEVKERKFEACLISEPKILSRYTEGVLRTVRLDIEEDVAEDTILFNASQQQYATYLPDVGTLESNGLTISTWIWLQPTLSSNPLTILSKISTSQFLYGLSCNSDGSLEFQYFSAGAMRSVIFSGACSMLEGAWHHLGVVVNNRDPAQWRLNVFIDGQLFGSQDILQPVDSSGRVFIGARPQSGLSSPTEYYFNGRLHLLVISPYSADRNRLQCVIGCGIVLLSTLDSSPLAHYYDFTRRALIVEGTQPIGPYEDFLNSLVMVLPFTEPRVSSYLLSYTVQDAMFNCLPTSIDIIVIPSNDFMPELSLNGGTSTDYSTTFTEEEGPVALVNQTSFFLTDMDLVAFEYVITVRVLDPLQPSSEEILAVQNVPEGMNVTYESSHTLTLTGLLPLPLFEAALRTLTYDNTADEPVGVTRQVSVTVSDPPEPDVSAATTISIVYVNDPPELAMVSSAVEYSEGDGAVLLLQSGTVSDSDNSTLVSATVSFNALDGTLESLAADTSSTAISATFDPTSATLTLTGEDSLQNYTSALLSITYEHSGSSDPTPGTRVFRFVLSDGEDEGEPELVMLFFAAVNDAPVIDLNGASTAGLDYQVTFVEDLSPAVAIVSPNATIVDVDNDTLASVTIALSPVLDQEELFVSIPDQVGLEVLENGAQVVLQPVVGASVSVYEYEAALRSAQYQNSAEEPTPGTRTVTFTASDGVATSIPAVTTVAVVAANDRPMLDLDTVAPGTGYEAEDFIEDGSAVYITARSVEVSDNDFSATVQLVTLTLQNPMDGFDEKIESTDTNVTIPTPNLVNGVSLTYMIPLDGAVLPDVASLLTTLQYRNARSEPTPGLRVIAVALSDGADFSNTAIVTVLVVGVNENAPVFTQDAYSSTVLESEAPPTPVVTVTAVDLDDGIDGTVSYEIAGSTPPEGLTHFTINGSTGVISTAVELDRETIELYILNISANDGGIPQHQAYAIVNIQLQDANDNAPEISPENNFTLTVLESRGLQFAVETVQVEDPDLSLNGQFTLESLPNQDTPFTVDVGSGDILVSRSLDVDRGPDGCIGDVTYVLTVVATDLGSPMMSSEANFSITVLDVNDNAPVFESGLSGSVRENQPVGTGILTIAATDRDCTSNADITYSIQNSSMAQLFSIDPATGVVSSQTSFDREDTESYQFTVVATDGGNPRLSSSAVVGVSVADENDNAPMFSQAVYEMEVREDVENGTLVLVVQATDADVGSNSELRYSIEPNTEVTPPFSTNPLFVVNPVTGQVMANEMLDFELQESITFTVVATDSGSPALRGSANVTVRVTDVNDNAPVFSPLPSPAEVPENEVGVLVTTVTADDSDSGTNGQVTYRLLNSDQLFSLNATSGEITTVVGLDFETECYFQLVVEANDGGFPSQSASLVVGVSVLPVNDNHPVFSSALYAASIPENQPGGSIVVQVAATDADQATCSREESGSALFSSGMGLDVSGDDITYSFSTVSDSFTVDSTTGLITLSRPLDRETQSEHILTVIAADSSLSSEATVRVSVLDVNDNSPQFLQPAYEATAAENTPVGTSVLQVFATDADSIDQGRLIYSLSGNPDYFDIGNTSGVISVSGVINFESVGSEVTLLAQVTDTALNTNTVPVTITVTDTNDLPPVIHTLPQLLTFTEGQVSLRPFPRMNISDPDSFQQLCSAHLTLSSPQQLNEETVDQCQCTDAQSASSCTPGCMEFLQIPIGAFPGEVQQSQQGFQLSLVGNYSIEEYEAALEAVEYVNIIFNPVPQSRTVSLYVTDCQLASNTLIQTISIELLNVFAPVLDLNGDAPGINFQMAFRERGNPITIVSENVTISDQDTVGPEQELTSIDVWLANPLDPEQESIYLPQGADLPGGITITTHSAHNLSLSGPASLEDYTASLLLLRYGNLASEPDPTTRRIQFVAHEYFLSSEEATTEIAVATINDFPPTVYANPPHVNYLTTYTEGDAGVGVVSSDVIIQDDDSTNDMVIDLQVYILSASSHDQLFLSDSGASLSPLITFNQLSNSSFSFTGPAPRSDYEAALRGIQYQYTGDEFEFLFPPRFVFLQVADQSLSDFSAVQIMLSPVNDHLPVFREASTTVSVPENSTVGSSIVQLEFTDEDTFTLTEPLFSIVSGTTDNFFSITPDTGIVFLSRPLDFETSSFHSLMVELTDLGYVGPSAPNAVATVTILVSNLNDHVPSFTQDMYNTTVNEGAPIGTRVLQVSATDQDGETHSTLVFDVATTDFTIDSNGVIYTNADLDQETVASYEFAVTVRNPGDAAFDAAQVFVTVLDLDDHRPVVTLSPDTATLREPETLVTLADSLTITDRDSNPSLDYAIVELLDSAPGWLLSTASSPAVTVAGNGSSTLTFSGASRPLADYELVLRGVVYVDPAEEPLVITREIAYQVGSDPLPQIALEYAPRDTVSNVSILPVSVELINDWVPEMRLDTRDPANITLTLPDCTAEGSYSTTFSEDGAPVPLSHASLSITDADTGDTTIAWALVELLDGQDGNLESLQVTTSGGVTLDAADSSNSRLLLQGPASVTEFEAVLRTVTYHSLSQQPTGSSRQAAFVVSDGQFNSTPALACVQLIGVNDRPQLTLGTNGSVDVMLMYTEGQADPLPLAPLLEITGQPRTVTVEICAHGCNLSVYILSFSSTSSSSFNLSFSPSLSPSLPLSLSPSLPLSLSPPFLPLSLLPDVDTSFISSAFIILTGSTPEEHLEILNPLDFTVTSSATPGLTQLTVTASNNMAPVETFQSVLRSTVYSTTRQM